MAVIQGKEGEGENGLLYQSMRSWNVILEVLKITNSYDTSMTFTDPTETAHVSKTNSQSRQTNHWGATQDVTIEFVQKYLLLGLSFDQLEPGFVDAYIGHNNLRARLGSMPNIQPTDLLRQSMDLLAELPHVGLSNERMNFIAAHLRALACSARKFAGESVSFVSEVRSYFDVDISLGDQDLYRQAHQQISELLPGSGSLTDRMHAYQAQQEIPPDRLEVCVQAFSSVLRDRVRTTFGIDPSEKIDYQLVSDKPWSGFNYYAGQFTSRVAINTDLKQYLSQLPFLIAHEAYPGHHTEHCHKEAGIIADGQQEQTVFLVNTPQCLISEGLADLALEMIVGPNWGLWAQEIYADVGLRFDGQLAQKLSRAGSNLLPVRQDAALLLHDRGRSMEEVADFLQQWTLTSSRRAQQQLRFLTSPLWRAYISTYVEGYRLLREFVHHGKARNTAQNNATQNSAIQNIDQDREDQLQQFARLLHEPLVPSSIRAELV